MTKLDELVIEYKKTNNQCIGNQIYLLLKKSIQEKTKYLYYQQKFKGMKLCNLKIVDIEDVEQELYLELARIIKNYNVKKGSFSTYWYSTLWNYKPKFINVDFFNQLKNTKTYKLNEDDEEESLIDHIASFPAKDEINIFDMFEKLTDEEKKLINILKKKEGINQSELADIFGVTQPYISSMFDSIRKKYKNYL
jgi:RNA polymerase sigma factor (sigma-70 family)